MDDFQHQLADLRRRIAQVSRACDRKYRARERADSLPHPSHRYVEERLNGEEVTTAHGRHFETEKLYEKHRRHGSADIGSIGEDSLAPLSNCIAPPGTWAFLDTETSGVSSSGGCAFLIGVGRIAPDGFRVRQFFMRDLQEEASQLDALARYLAPFRVLITYNGLAFDRPLLDARCRFHRLASPFARMGHVDLLHAARRLWKLRFESCRLADLETRILGVEREGDVPGALIPYLYFEYLRTREALRLLPVFHHNALDIVSLACLTSIVPHAFRDSSCLVHGAEMVAVARWLRETGEHRRALDLFRRGIDAGLPDSPLFQTLWDAAALDRKLGGVPLAIWNDLASSKNPYRARAMEELAKHYEHQEKDYVRALEFTRGALELEDSAPLRKREERIRRRLRSW